ncbi:MAG: sugar phosphate nucleotidyltransferase, partial [Gammaproteobacteria bacterium]
SSHDFGRDILPRLIDSHAVYAHRFGGTEGRVTPDRYWRDVGTIDAYYAANMDLLESVPPLNLYQNDWTIRTYQRQTPPARTVPGSSGTEGIFINSILAGGSVVSGGSIQHSVLFPQVFVDDEAFVEDAILFEGVRIGAGAQVSRCIIDKHVQVPPGERIGHDRERDAARFTVSEAGVVVVPKGYRF